MSFKQIKYYWLYKLSLGKIREKYKAKYRKEAYLLTDLHNEIKHQMQYQFDALQQENQVYAKKMDDLIHIQHQLKEEIKNEIEKKFEKLEVQRLHTLSFKNYKNKYEGKDVALVATGASLNSFQPLENVIYIGVNRSFLCEKITLDYLFIQDYEATRTYFDQSYPYKNPELKRFYGILDRKIQERWIIPDYYLQRHHASPYFVRSIWNENPSVYQPDLFLNDITSDKLICYGSIVFPALQFILYTNPKRLYLVGCDAKNSGQFVELATNMPETNFSGISQGWQYFKEFAEKNYPDLEIISINPVGLKGLFKDITQAAFTL